MILNKVKLIYDFFRLWIKWRDCKEAWEDAKFINDKEIQRELGEAQILPCNFDHNGECLICDCWVSDCAYLRYLNGDYKWETREELEEMFKKSKVMNKEQQELLNEVYRKYADSHEYFVDGWLHVIPMEHSKETFVNECKTNTGFSKKWGLNIEERELNVDELNIVNLLKQTSTKLITITYNDKTIESYE
jgi:hypothetical protein